MATVPPTPNEIKWGWITRATPKLEDATYPARCSRGYDEVLANGTNELVRSNFGEGPCHGGDSCTGVMSGVGGTWDTTGHTGVGEYCGATGTFSTNSHYKLQCYQTSWPLADKEACCAGTVDNRSRCAPDTCPMSKGCGDTQAMVNHCSGVMDDGSSRLMNDPNCRNWCTDFPGRCDQAKRDLCTRHGDLKECGCIAPQRNPTYQKFLSQVRSLGMPLPTTASYCWNPLCDGEDMVEVLKTTNITTGEKVCPAQQLNICNQIIQLQEGASENVIDNADFSVVCGQSLPPHTEPDPRDDDPGPGPDTPTGDGNGAKAKLVVWWNSLTKMEKQVAQGSGVMLLVALLIALFL